MKRREKVLLIRWSIFAMAVAVAFWAVWSLCGGEVPSSDAFMPWPLQDLRLPFHASRWWDVALAAPWVAAIWRLSAFSDACEKKIGEPGEFVMGTTAVGSLVMLFIGIITATVYQAAWLTAGLIVFGLVAAVYAAVYRNRWAVPDIISFLALAFLLTGGASSGPFHAFLWTLMATTVAGAAACVGRLARLAGRPIAALGRWLGGEGVTDDSPTVQTRQESPAPAEKPAPPNPLTEFVGLASQLASIDGEVERLEQHRAELQARLRALRAEPEAAKLLALRAERPVA